LETIKNHFKNKKIKFYQASTSELYGKVIAIPQNEKTPFYPRSPYAVAKLYSYWITINYREAFNIFGCNGILFNHESPRRGKNFITRKITYNLSKIYFGLINFFEVGNLDAQRDWGHAKDFVEMQWLMLQQKKASDYVISTEKVFSVRQFIIMAAKEMGIQIGFKGKGLKEYGFVKKIFKQKDFNCKIKISQRIVKINKKFYRPSEVKILKGSSKKAKKELNWKPKISFKDMIKEMVDSDMQLIKNKIK
jgi:GDPmannose 4,6-dehydratase